MVLTNYKCTKSLYFSTLRYNYLPKKKKKNQKIMCYWEDKTKFFASTANWYKY